MNKLVSKNPIQRFKQGKKLIKAQKGWNGTFRGISPSGKVKLRDVPGITEEYNPQWENVMSQDQINQLVNTGYFNKDQSFSSVTAFQNALKNFLANEGWETGQGLKVDGMWGDQTQKAFETALLKSKSPVYSVDGEIHMDKTPINPIVNPINVQPKISATLPTYTKTYNKSDIRNFIRSKGKGAYDFTGSQRKALRMVMNGQGTDEDRATVKAMGIFKQGGLLPSRNIIERFKQGKKLIKAKGGLDNTFKLLSDTAERTAEREKYWAEEEAKKARIAYDRQMKSSKKSKTNVNKDIQQTIPFESTQKFIPLEIAQVPEVSGIYSSLSPTQTSKVPVIDISKVPSTGKFYNRADVRDYMRRHGVNAYSYTSDYRKALRKVLNGQGSQDDYNMIRAMGLKLKKGGLLPSCNPIQRF